MNQLSNMMKQVQQMQAQFAQAQKQMELVEIEGVSGAGLVKVTLSGAGDVKKVSIDPSLLVADEREVLEDLVVAAMRDAKQKLNVEMEKNFKLPPGMKLPF